MPVIDLHVHTSRGSRDSSLDPVEMILEARRVGLDGVVITEHDKTWTRWEVRALREEYGFLVLRGMEVTTDLGHVLAIGLDQYVSGIHRAEHLRRVIDDVGGVLIAPHPFRHLVSLRPGLNRTRPVTLEEALSLPIFDLVDEIEALNGATADEENALALKVARARGRQGTGGSDAHSHHGLGCCATYFERPIRDEEDLIRELKAGRFRAIYGQRRPGQDGRHWTDPVDEILDDLLAMYGYRGL